MGNLPSSKFTLMTRSRALVRAHELWGEEACRYIVCVLSVLVVNVEKGSFVKPVAPRDFHQAASISALKIWYRRCREKLAEMEEWNGHDDVLQSLLVTKCSVRVTMTECCRFSDILGVQVSLGGLACVFSERTNNTVVVGQLLWWLITHLMHYNYSVRAVAYEQIQRVATYCQ